MANVDAPSPRSLRENGGDDCTLRVGIVVINGSNAINFMGPSDAFNEASRSNATPIRYQVDLIAVRPGPIVCSSGIRMLPAAKRHFWMWPACWSSS